MDEKFEDEELFGEFLLTDKTYIKSSRVNNAHNTRRKVEAHLDRKRLREADEYDSDIDNYDFY